jgi:predicted TIM-barrel fold metal-dependent hydrolase
VPRNPAVPPGAIDTHALVFTRDLRLAPNARYVPEAEAPVERYLDLLDQHGLAAGVLVQPSFLASDNRYLLQAIARVPARFRGIAVVTPTVASEELARLKNAGIVGVRLNLMGREPPDFAASPWPQHFAALSRAGLHVQVHAEGPRWLQILKPLLAAGVRLVIDHFGRPSDGMGPRCPGFQSLAAAARDADIWFKLSAPYRLLPTTAAWACADVLLTIPGPGRLVWGSDWPWTQHPHVTRYSDTLAWLSEWVRDAGAREQILGANARTLFGFNKPPGVATPMWKRL